MKQAKKLWSLLLAFVLVLSLTNGFTAKADTTDTATSITVTLRVEQDEATLVAPVKITLTDEDKKDFGIGLSTDTLTPLHALAKYMEQYANATDDTMGEYIDYSTSSGYSWINSISVEGKISEGTGGTPNSGSQENVSWMTAFNDMTGLSNPDENTSSTYPLKDNDSITFYGVWYGVYGSIDSYYTIFDKQNYSAETNQSVSISLKGVGIYTADTVAKDAISNATILVGEYSDTKTSVTRDNAISSYTTKTDENGIATIKFTKAGTYVLSAYRDIEVDEDSDENTPSVTHNDISRPYAIVTVTDAKTEEKKEDEQPAAAVEPTNVDTITPTQQSTAKMPAQVKGLKKTISKKFKKKKKTVTLTWKKTTNATSYQIYISKKKNSGYKKTATTKGLKKALKLKKGTYYVKVRAYNKSGYFYKYGKFSNVVKIKIKK